MELIVKNNVPKPQCTLMDLENGIYLCNVENVPTQTLIIKTWQGVTGFDVLDYTSLRSWRDDSNDYRRTRLFNVVPVDIVSLTVTPK